MSNSELLRLNFNNKLRFQYKLGSNSILPSYTFNCNNIVSTLSVNNVCSITHKQRNISVTNHDKNILTSNVNLNIINTDSTNSFTVVTSSRTKLRHHVSTIPYHFTSFTNHSQLLSNPIVNVITFLFARFGVKK